MRRILLRNWSIRTKVFLLALGMVLGPLLLAAYEGDRVSRQALLDQGVRNLQAHAHRLAEALDRLLAERQEEAAWIAAATAIRHHLLTPPARRASDRPAAREALHHMSAMHGGRFAVFLFDATGRLVLASDEALPQPAGIPARPFFAEALGGKPSASPPALDGGKPFLYFGAPVQGEDARVAGVVVLRAAAEEFWDIVDRAWQEAGPESAAIVTDEAGVRIARAGRRDLLFHAWAPLPPERAQQILAERRYGEGITRIAATEMPEVLEALRDPGRLTYFTHRLVTGPRYHAAGVMMKRRPWIITASIPEESFFSPIHQHRRRVGLFILGAVILSVAVSLAVSRILTGKVRLLAQAAHEIAEGRLQTYLPSHGGDELAQLTRSFNRMASAIRSQMGHVSDLYAVALALIHARKREDLVDCVLQRGTELVRSHASALILLDEQRGRFGGIFAHALPKGLLEETPWATSPQGECFLKGAPVIASVVPGRGMGLGSLLRHAGFNSSISLPLVVGEERLGVLTLYDRERTEWGADQIVLLSAFAHLVSLALKSMQTLEAEHRKTEHLTVLNEMAVSLASELDLETLLEKIVQAARLLVTVECGAILVLKEETEQVAYFRCTGETPREQPPAYPPQGGVLWRALSERCAVRLNNLTEDVGAAGLPPGHPTIRSYLGVPLIAKGRLIGEIYLVNRVGEGGFTQEDEDLLGTLASQASIAVQNARLHQQAMTLAITDGLTGLYNHRHFQEILEREAEEARRHGRPLSLIMADLDFFKDYNDAYGHLAGDRLLQMIADVLRAAVREIDYVARYGGEEFAVILPDSDREGVLRVAERIRSQLHQWQVPHASCPLGVVTLSLGVASLPADAESAERLLTRADAALYEAKRRGRNRVEVPTA